MKNKKTFFRLLTVLIFFVVVSFVSPDKVSAHCDTLDGPVVNAARKALNTENVNYVLIWVKPENEVEIRKALKRARDKRKKAKSKEEKDQADMEFFETLVKIHREGEGAEYEGIKPAGSVEPEIAMADTAVKTKTLDDVIKHIKNPGNKKVIAHLFHTLQEKSNYGVDDVSSGRKFIESYVIFIHAVEKAVKGEILKEKELHDH